MNMSSCLHLTILKLLIFDVNYISTKSPFRQGLRRSKIFFVFCPMNKSYVVQNFEIGNTKKAYKAVYSVRNIFHKKY